MTLCELPQQQSVHHPSLLDRPVEHCCNWPAHNTPIPTHRHTAHQPFDLYLTHSRLRRSYRRV